MLRGYYDGSGMHSGSEVLTLAGLVASESVWRGFEESWGAVLREYKITPFHAKDAMARRREFARKNDWDEATVERMVWDLWKVVSRFRATKESPYSNLTATSCTILLREYGRAKQDKPALREPEAICVQLCVTRMPTDLDSVSGHPQIALIFDRNEPFLHTIHRVWQDYTKKPNAGWARQISHISTIDREAISTNSSYINPLQAVDLLAWSMQRSHYASDSRPSWTPVISLMVEHFAKTYDYTTLMHDFPNG